MKNRFRNINADIIARLLIASGFSNRVKKKALRGDFIISLYFHSPDRSLFEFCIKWLQKNGFKFLSEKDVLRIANEESAFPEGGVIITVDDGWRSNDENVIEVANKYNVPVTIFVTTDAIEQGNFWWPYVLKAHDLNLNYPSIEELKKIPNRKREAILTKIKKEIVLERQALDLSQLKKASRSKFINIGAHTVHHPILPNCEDEEAFLEIEKSKEQIEEWLDKEVVSFAYPNGDYSGREIEYLEKLNFLMAYTTLPDYLTNERIKRIYELPRFCIYEGVTNAEAVCRMMGVWQRFFKN